MHFLMTLRWLLSSFFFFFPEVMECSFLAVISLVWIPTHAVFLEVPSSPAPTEYPNFRPLGRNSEQQLMCHALAHWFGGMLFSRFLLTGYFMLLSDYFSDICTPSPFCLSNWISFCSFPFSFPNSGEKFTLSFLPY